MKESLDLQIDKLRHFSRKMVRELGMLQIKKDTYFDVPEKWHLMTEVSRNPEVTISKLSSLLLMSVPKASRLVASLVKNNFLTYEEGIDKREKFLKLTAQGEMKVAEINDYSNQKILGAFDFLSEADTKLLIQSIEAYANALEKSRLMAENIKIMTISTSRPLRLQIKTMLFQIQSGEYQIPVTDEINECVMRAEDYFYYDNSMNFWYAANEKGEVVGCCGLQKLNDEDAEIRKFFVVKKYRGKGVAQKLLQTVAKAAEKHKFKTIFLGTVSKLHAAQKFYSKYGFTQQDPKTFPKEFEIGAFDTHFFKAETKKLAKAF